MGFLSQLFNSPKALTKLVSAGVNAADALVLTKEEKQRHHAKLAELSLKYLEASKGQNIARRCLALLIGSVWGICFLARVLFSSLGPFLSNEGAIKAQTSAAMLHESLREISGLVTIIIVFYFSLPHTAGIASKVSEKFMQGKQSDFEKAILERERKRLLSEPEQIASPETIAAQETARALPSVAEAVQRSRVTESLRPEADGGANSGIAPPSQASAPSIEERKTLEELNRNAAVDELGRTNG